MSWRPPHAAWSAALLAGFALAVAPGPLVVPCAPASDALLYDQAAGGRSAGPNSYQRIQKTAAGRLAQYGFLNFNRDRFSVSYSMPEKPFLDYNASFGYSKEGLDEMKAFRETAYKSVYVMAVRDGRPQAQLDAAVTNIDKEYRARVRDYLAQQGFKMLPGNIVAVDMPVLVRRNAVALKPLALAIENVARSRRYRSGEIIGAALSFVQIALHYRVPDLVYKGKHTGGVLPPVTAVLLGWGDCDTKTGVMASLLANWPHMRMVGVAVPKHYLLGVLLIPEKGDLYLEYQDLRYVLVEPAGPAWLPPGRVTDGTVALLNSREGYQLEPFF